MITVPRWDFKIRNYLTIKDDCFIKNDCYYIIKDDDLKMV
jgi:hypothetical protein